MKSFLSGKMHFSAVFLAALACVAAAAPSGISKKYVLHEKRDGHLIAWKKHSRAFKEQVLPVRIGLKQRNLHHGG